MGFFSKIFGEKIEFPEMDASSPLAQRMEQFRGDLEGLAKEVSDPIEVIPAGDTAYVFMGKPPKKFGMAWIKEGKINNFKTLSQEGITEMKLQLLSEKLRTAYEKSSQASRFSTTIADHKIIVTNSDSLEHDLKEILK